MSEHHEESHELNYSEPITIFFFLIVYTVLTVAIAGKFDSAWGSFLAAFAVASVKATLVLRFFMHLKYESKIFTVFLGLAIMTFMVIFGLLFSDYGFRW